MEDLQKVNRALNDLWKLFKKLNGFSMTDDQANFWLDRTKEIYEESGESELVMDLIAAFTNSLEGGMKK